jgi:hypothetical protein
MDIGREKFIKFCLQLWGGQSTDLAPQMSYLAACMHPGICSPGTAYLYPGLEQFLCGSY